MKPDDFNFDDKLEVTSELVEYYRKNPKELDLIVDREHFYSKFIQYFFFAGIILTVGSRIMKYFFEGEIWDFFSHVVLDIFSELGIAIFGGAITAYLLEYLQKKQYDENMRFREEVKSRIDKLNSK